MATDTTTPAPKRPRTSKPTSLVSKLAAVMGAVDRLEKTAVAEMGNFSFSYVEEHQILEALRGELSSRQIMIIPEITDIVKDGQFTTLKMKFHIHDGESGEIITSEWASHAADSRDFGCGKACTQSVKYYLLKAFLLPTWERNGAANPVPGDVEHSSNLDRVRTETPRTPPPAPTGSLNASDSTRLFITEYKAVSGQTNGKGWVRYAIEFSDGRKVSTFSDELGDLAEHAATNNLPVRATLEPSARNPKYLDLVELALDGDA